MRDDVILNKIAITRRCIKRVNEEYAGNPDNLTNFTKQDAIILNIQRACEACIDMAMHIVKEKDLGLPQNSRDAFEMLLENNIIDCALNTRLKAMVGFRNIAVHDYQSVNVNILKNIIQKHLSDFDEFIDAILSM